ncbi:MAG: hypothetical protein ACD_62C00244G0011 [uncultured bacterium]|nr:MAG: hypothetical protein ACD_62C00244G0011 [uncultured bacterium]HLD44344.1 bifunctional phosphopantothenoylcysteine decarboxylase/phosphopantothenate--cysteine ligase CoaBC [bacterium]
MPKPKKILITAGPTQEPIDPIRYLSNHSSGKMGYALARACVKAGHQVVLISGPTNLVVPEGVVFVAVTTAREMYRQAISVFPSCDLVFKVAAVADYRVKKKSLRKIKKTGETMLLELVRNPDILKKLGQLKKPHQTLIGFAAETHKGAAYAQKKLRGKNLDWIALNEINKHNVGFGRDDNEVTLISSGGRKVIIPKQGKDAVAKIILETVYPTATP